VSRKDEQHLDGELLGVRLCFSQDRFGHEIRLCDGTNQVGVLRSLEGAPDEKWPASPPFQSLHVERREQAGAERQVALLVGMSGKSHWSASIEVDRALRQARFDIACRTGETLKLAPASRYRISQDVALEKVGDRRIVLRVPQLPTTEMVLEAFEGEASARIEEDSQGLAIVADDVQRQSGKRTIRWAYTLSAVQR
jgi:hypothetical protein